MITGLALLIQMVIETANSMTPTEEFEEMLLHASRNGDHFLVEEILQARSEGRIKANIDCKGRSKSNNGWAPLHLACYFGHVTVAEILLKNNANVDIRNNAGDTPLHKASFTGREALVILLLKFDADVNIINGEGQTPKDLALVKEIRKLLEGAEKTEMRKKEERLLCAAREGDVGTINELFKGTSPPNINCVDAFGNTALHCAAYRCQKEVAVLLLQHGVDPSLYNKRGQRAADLAPSPQMKQILDVQPIRTLQRHVARFEGPIMKRSRFLGWKNLWAVLERGVLTYFNCRADACGGVNRKGFKQLDRAKVIPLEFDTSVIIIHFSDNTTHRLSLPSESGQLTIQKWMNSFQEHIAYCTHYINQGTNYEDSDEEEMPDMLKLGSLHDVLQTAQAYQQLLERQVDGIENIFQVKNDGKTVAGVNQGAIDRLHHLADTSRNMVVSLGHCLSIFMQQEEVRLLQLKQEQEKCRVLEQALHVLAKEHHELEQSISTTPFHSPKSFRSLRSPRFYDTSDDEFYDASEGGKLLSASFDLATIHEMKL